VAQAQSMRVLRAAVCCQEHVWRSMSSARLGSAKASVCETLAREPAHDYERPKSLSKAARRATSQTRGLQVGEFQSTASETAACSAHRGRRSTASRRQAGAQVVAAATTRAVRSARRGARRSTRGRGPRPQRATRHRLVRWSRRPPLAAAETRRRRSTRPSHRRLLEVATAPFASQAGFAIFATPTKSPCSTRARPPSTSCTRVACT